MDAVTAAKDLQELGVNYTQEQLDRIKRAEEQRLRQRRMEREAKERERLAAVYDPKTDVPPDVPAGVHQYAGDDQPPQGCHDGYIDLL